MRINVSETIGTELVEQTMGGSTPIYNAIILELERQRMAMGLSMERMSELMGAAERSYAKLVYPDTPSGRVARWQTLQAAVAVLFCDGFQLRIDPGKGGMLTPAGTKRLIMQEAAHFNRPSRRVLMQKLGALGGKTAAERMSAIERRERGRLAGLASAQRRRSVQIEVTDG